MQDGSSPLYAASMKGDLEAVRILIDVKADINAKGAVCDPPYVLHPHKCVSVRMCVRAGMRQGYDMYLRTDCLLMLVHTHAHTYLYQ